MTILVGCATSNTAELEADDKSAEQLYNIAKDSLDKGRLVSAAREFDEVERLYPYSPWATRAQLMAAYTHYENQSYEMAEVALDRFIDLHPTHKDVAYAWYLKALCSYEQITDVGRDQEMTARALDGLRQVVRRFPDTNYARDASLKIDLTRDHLAGKEMEIGRFYLNKRQWLAAIKRFKVVVADFETTTHVQEALHRLVEANLAIGLLEEAKQNAAVLGHNYPGSRWYKDAYQLLQDYQG